MAGVRTAGGGDVNRYVYRGFGENKRSPLYDTSRNYFLYSDTFLIQTNISATSI